MAKADETGKAGKAEEAGKGEKAEALKRIGGGRWETKDGRFQIEPQSGTWVIVDTAQTNEFGLPLVRGPFPSLTAAKTAIETERDSGPATSPLAGRLEQAAKAEPPRKATGPRTASRDSGASDDGADATSASVQPPEPPEPLWLRNLKPVGRQKARDLMQKLASLGIAEAEAIARAEVADGDPALARLAIERSIRDAVQGKRSVDAAVRAAVDVIASGKDDELGVGWSLVDDRSRTVGSLEIGDEDRPRKEGGTG